ncbi:TPA: hypothetical protein L7J85_005379, partial [Klebsiella pneumoniae]|nr:hypothetical protein [Klebsiella pneumoniae]
MTDITELAQREKFEAWWERTQHNGNPPRFGWSHWRDGEGYKVDDDNSELDGMWSAWKAAGAELVEALEKAQQRIDSQREYYDGVIADGGKRIAELESRTVKLPDGCQFEECEIEGCENGAIFSVGTGSRNIHLCDKCAHEPQNSRLKKSPLSKRLPFKMSAGIKV